MEPKMISKRSIWYAIYWLHQYWNEDDVEETTTTCEIRKAAVFLIPDFLFTYQVLGTGIRVWMLIYGAIAFKLAETPDPMYPPFIMFFVAMIALVITAINGNGNRYHWLFAGSIFAGLGISIMLVAHDLITGEYVVRLAVRAFLCQIVLFSLLFVLIFILTRPKMKALKKSIGDYVSRFCQPVRFDSRKNKDYQEDNID